MGAVTIAVSVLAVTGVVGEEGSTALELGVRSGDTSVNDVGAGTGASRVVVGVGSTTLVLVRDAGKTPGRRSLSNVGLLLEVQLAKIGPDNGILLNVVDLYYVNTLEGQVRN